MIEKRKKLLKRLLIIPPLIIGIAVVIWQVNNKQGPQQEPVQESAKKVRVMTVAEMSVVPRALGFGNVAPGMIWQAVTEISGQIVEIHPQLKKGAILPKGIVALKIDPTDYQLNLQKTKADIRALQAQITEVKERRVNTRASLAIDNRSLKLAENDLKRKQTLLRRKTVSQAAVDQEERNLLARRQSAQSLKNTLNLLPAEEERLNAQLAALNIQLETVKRNLARTTITLPFDARIAEVSIEQSQFAKLGQTVIIADSIDIAEVSAQVPIEKMQRLVSSRQLQNVTAASAMANIEKNFDLKPIVRFNSGNLNAAWQGRVARISDQVDPRTRTVGVIVAVDNPYNLNKDTTGPPLTKNMYVEVELRGSEQKNKIVIPRQALHTGSKVYVTNSENRLQIRVVTVHFLQGGLAVIKSGLKAGERIAISDLVPAIDGMLLSPEEDQKAVQALVQEAAGEGPLK